MEAKLTRKLVKYKLQEIENIEDFLVNYLTTLSEDEQNKFFEVDEKVANKKYKIYYPPNYPGRIFLVKDENEIYLLGWTPGDEVASQYHFYKYYETIRWACKKSSANCIVCRLDYPFEKGYLETINPVGEYNRIPENFKEAELLLKAYEYLWENW